MNRKRRAFLGAAGVMLLAGMSPASGQDTGRRMKIGVIGSGRIGGTIGGLWVKAGYEVMFSAREIGEVRGLVASLGPRARAGTPREAAAFGEVILISVPYRVVPELGRDLAAELKGKVVLETGNPYPSRDGNRVDDDMLMKAWAKGMGVASAEFLPGVRLVRAFNSVAYHLLRSEAHRAGERVAIPLAADDEAAMKIAAKLVEDAGFEPVPVGPLARAKEFDRGTAVYDRALTARELRAALGLAR